MSLRKMFAVLDAVINCQPLPLLNIPDANAQLSETVNIVNFGTEDEKKEFLIALMEAWNQSEEELRKLLGSKALPHLGRPLMATLTSPSNDHMGISAEFRIWYGPPAQWSPTHVAAHGSHALVKVLVPPRFTFAKIVMGKTADTEVDGVQIWNPVYLPSKL
jgi:hypothetical protein